MRRSLVVLVAFGLVGCGGGGGGGGAGDHVAARGTPLVLAAGLAALEPAPDGTFTEGLDLARLGLSDVDAVYDVTTPAGDPFRFERSRASGSPRWRGSATTPS